MRFSKKQLLKNYWQETSLFQHRVITGLLITIILLAVLISRLVYLQVDQGQLYKTLSIQNQVGIIPLAPKRGLIFDRNGIILAENKPIYSLDITPDHVHNLKFTITRLSKIITITPEEITQFKRARKQHRSFSPIPLKLKLTPEEVAVFSVNQFRFPGVTVNARLLRNYPKSETLASVLGYVGRINSTDLMHFNPANYSASNYIGKIGIEKYYESQLHGIAGYEQVEMDASGHVVRVIKRTAPIPGNDIYLTIDSKLQEAAEEALGENRGAVVVIDPNNGQVLALVSKPGYDPNLFVHGIPESIYHELQAAEDRPLFNRVVRGQYPLASTIKPLLALEGLALGVINPKARIYDPGYFQLPNSQHIYHDWKKLGWVDLHKAIVMSCDTYFYMLSLKLGIRNIDKIMAEFGYGKRTGIQLTEELPGLVASPEWKKRVQGKPWYPGDTVNSSIGQGYMLATPVQLADAVASLSKRGVRYQPTLLLKFQLPNSEYSMNPPISLPPVPIEDQKTWSIVIKAMQDVVLQGTARGFGSTPYSVAAKTGTGQVYKPAKYGDLDGYDVPEKYRSHSLFIAFAPIDEPQIAVSVVVENSPHTATHVARKVMDYYFNGDDDDENSDDNANKQNIIPAKAGT